MLEGFFSRKLFKEIFLNPYIFRKQVKQGGLAQMVERSLCKQRVPGWMPGTSINLHEDNYDSNFKASTIATKITVNLISQSILCNGFLFYCKRCFPICKISDSTVQSTHVWKYLQEIAIQIYDLCNQFNIKLVPAWIPRELNEIADFMSKYNNTDSWGIDF